MVRAATCIWWTTGCCKTRRPFTVTPITATWQHRSFCFTCVAMATWFRWRSSSSNIRDPTIPSGPHVTAPSTGSSPNCGCSTPISSGSWPSLTCSGVLLLITDERGVGMTEVVVEIAAEIFSFESHNCLVHLIIYCLLFRTGLRNVRTCSAEQGPPHFRGQHACQKSYEVKVAY